MKDTERPWAISFDHAAIATSDPEKIRRVFSLIGLTDGGSEAVPSQGVVTHFLKTEKCDPAIEILEVSDPEGTVAKFLKKKGPGIHHLSFKLKGERQGSALDLLCVELRKNGIRLIYDKPQPGAHHTRVNFIHPESTGGILIEISEVAS